MLKGVLTMDNEKPMQIVLIEDDSSACRKFMECANSRTDIVFVGMTGRSDEGLEYVRDKLPEAVILDMELNWGEGSGLDFLEKIQKTDLSIRPIIVVTTRNRSEIVQESLHEYNVEWVFCKKQKGYSQEMVINHLLKLRPYLHTERYDGHNPSLQTLETPEELRNRVTQRIIAELNAVGISTRLKGRTLVIEAIFRLLNKDRKDTDTIFQDLAKAHKTHYNNVVRNIQTAIQDAWYNSDIETLEKLYTAPVRKDLGAPSPTEFIYYYADKIRRSM